jgi:hypothetical protein
LSSKTSVQEAEGHMKKFRIKIVDGDRARREALFKSTEPFNLLAGQDACRRRIWTRDQKGETLVDESSCSPDIFFLLINDQRTPNGADPDPSYIEHNDANFKNALFVIYSGGDIETLSASGSRMALRQAGKTWEFKVADIGRYCIVRDSVDDDGNPLNVTIALESLAEGASREQFFRLLTNNEQNQEYMLALSVLCQGYLAVFVDPATGNPDPLPRCPQASYHDAVQLMGLNVLLSNEGPARGFLTRTIGDPVKRRGLQQEVSLPRWWRIFGDDCKRRLRDEWGNNDLHGLTRVEALVDRFSSMESVDVGCVADAFCALAAKLANPSPR